MWICPACNQKFLHQNQSHSCNDKTVADFLQGKSAHTVALFYYFLDAYLQMGSFFCTRQNPELLWPATLVFVPLRNLAKISSTLFSTWINYIRII